MRRYLFLTVTLVIFFLFTTNVFAATYYVATTGDNADPGTEAEPWLTLTYAENTISEGDTVIIRGGIYQEVLKITKSNTTFRAYTSETPVIDGNGVLPTGDTGWDPLLYIKAKWDASELGNNVTIDGLTIRRSTGYGIHVSGTDGGADNVTIKNCVVYQNYQCGIVIWTDADNVLVEDCEAYQNVMCIVGGYSGNQPVLTGSAVSSQIITSYCDAPIFRRCSVHDSYYEGFNIDRFTTNAVVEYCEIYGNRQLQLYLVNSTSNTVRYNLIYGVNPNAVSQDGTGSGIWVGNESRWNTPVLTTENKIYGNLVANCKKNMWIAGDASWQVKNCYIYNNTFVEATQYGFKMEPGTGDGHRFKNNIIWQNGATIADIPSGKVKADLNLWSQEPDGDVKGLNDPTYFAPLLSKTSGWSSLTGGELTGKEFALKATSPAIDAGTPIGAEFVKIPECNKSVWKAQISLGNQDSQGSGWEIGADIHVENAQPLAPPEKLTISHTM